MPFFHANGHRLFYREQGEGPLILLLPGNTASSAHMQRDMEYFSQRYQAVALDFLGTGQSQRVAVWPEDWWQKGARDALTLVEHLGAKQAVFIGTSGGAVAALWAAIFEPGRVRAVVSDNTGEFVPAVTMRPLLAERGQHTPGQVRFWSDGHGADWQQVVAEDTRICALFGESGGDWFKGRLKEIACPVLFTASLADSLLPNIGPEVVSMASQVSGSQAFLANSGDHPLMWSAPAAFRPAVDNFLFQVDGL